jgi:hypothetical protein
MTRDDLSALRDALDTVLTWPYRVRDQVAQWLAPEAAKLNGKPNGADQQNGQGAGTVYERTLWIASATSMSFRPCRPGLWIRRASSSSSHSERTDTK